MDVPGAVLRPVTEGAAVGPPGGTLLARTSLSFAAGGWGFGPSFITLRRGSDNNNLENCR